MIKTIKIGHIDIYPNLLLAPMAGITDIYFREKVKSFGHCGLTCSELVSIEGIVRSQTKTISMLKHADNETPFSVQLYGSRPGAFAEAAIIAVDKGADIIDVNAGCPARKVYKNQGGSYLLGDLKLLEDILKKVRKSINVPLTLKIRSGLNVQNINFIQVGKMAQDCGVDAVTLHPRTRQEMFEKHSNWEHIRKLKNSISIPVIGNGDIFLPQDALKMFRYTNCDAIMIGRGIMKNPWLIKQIYEFIKTGKYTKSLIIEKVELCFEFVTLLNSQQHTKKKVGEMKKYCNWLIHDFPSSASWRKTLFNSKESEELVEKLEELRIKIRNHSF